MNECKTEDLGYKPTVSIITGVGWLIFIILWLAFFASNYVWEQNLAILLLSTLLLFLIVGGMWAVWSLKKIPQEGWEMLRIKGFKWRIAVSILLPFFGLIFLIVWFWFYALPFTVWQNIAVVLVVILFIGGCLGTIWARWGIMHEDEIKKFEDIGKEIEESFEGKNKHKESK
ncbi:MAG: hypothetical protein R6V50_05380 [Thermoplasmatota archaeon]